MRILKSVIQSLGRSPLKSAVTLLTVGLGVGVLVLSLGISGLFSRLMHDQLQRDGVVVFVANGSLNEAGEVATVRPGEFDPAVLNALATDVSGVEAVSPVSFTPWTNLQADGQLYQLRTVFGVGEEYAEVLGLTLIGGAFITAEDVAGGVRTAVISEGLASIMFGSAGAALGQSLRPPALGGGNGGGPGGRFTRAFVAPTFVVGGVFSDPGELQRRAYGVADMVIPYTAAFPQGLNRSFADRAALSRLTLRVTGSSLASIEAQVRSSLAQQYGVDVEVAVWEGTPNGVSPALEEARSTVATFSLVVNLLGFVLLITGCIGVLSIMLVEVLGRSKEIAIERALGAHRGMIVREFLLRSVLLVGASSLVGVVLSLVLAGPLTDVVLPIFGSVARSDVTQGVVTASAIAIGVGAAGLVGSVFGVLPVFSALRVPISDGFREA